MHAALWARMTKWLTPITAQRIPAAVDNLDISSILFSPTYDSRDSVVLPRKGNLTKLVAEYGTKFTSTINKVTRLLTVKAIAAMNRAVGINKKPAEDVAAAFLEANSLT